MPSPSLAVRPEVPRPPPAPVVPVPSRLSSRRARSQGQQQQPMAQSPVAVASANRYLPAAAPLYATVTSISSRRPMHGTMASRRHVVSTPQLTSRGFRPILGQCPLSPVAVARAGGPGGISSSDTAVAKGNSDPPPPPPVVGISSASQVDVVSSRGASIGTEAEMDALTDLIERVANEGRMAGSDTDNTATNARKERNFRRRRLLPPECVFPGAYVTIRFRDEEGGGGRGTRYASNDGGEDHHGRSIEVTFDATSALAEWAEAHGPLPAPEIHQAAPAPDDVSTWQHSHQRQHYVCSWRRQPRGKSRSCYYA